MLSKASLLNSRLLLSRAENPRSSGATAVARTDAFSATGSRPLSGWSGPHVITPSLELESAADSHQTGKPEDAAREKLFSLYPEYMAYFSHAAPSVSLTPERQAQLESYLAAHVESTDLRDSVRAAVTYSPTFRAILFAILERRTPLIKGTAPAGVGGLSHRNGDVEIAASPNTTQRAFTTFHELTHAFHRLVLGVPYVEPLEHDAGDFLQRWMWEEDMASALPRIVFSEIAAATRTNPPPPLPFTIPQRLVTQAMEGRGIGTSDVELRAENPGHFGWWLSERFPEDPRLQDERYWTLELDEIIGIAREHGVKESDIEAARSLSEEYVRPTLNKPIGYPTN
jgi:hypothetical protein